jgi:hypothetical protein
MGAHVFCLISSVSTGTAPDAPRSTYKLSQRLIPGPEIPVRRILSRQFEFLIVISAHALRQPCQQSSRRHCSNLCAQLTKIRDEMIFLPD